MNIFHLFNINIFLDGCIFFVVGLLGCLMVGWLDHWMVRSFDEWLDSWLVGWFVGWLDGWMGG